MVREVEPEDAIQAIRAVQPGIVLRTLAAGWNRLNPQMFAIRTTIPKHVDTTMVPSEELMWLRTTLVCREGSGWEVDEFCEAIADLPEGLEAEFYFPQNVFGSHHNCSQVRHACRESGFFTCQIMEWMFSKEQESMAQQSGDGAKAVDGPADDVSEGYEQSIQADPPEEAPVDTGRW